MTQLNMGDQLPEFTLKIGESDSITLPNDIETDFAIILFYRGHWWPFCRRLLDGYERNLAALREIGVSVYAATVDSLEETQKVAEPLSFPVAWGVQRELGDKLGSFWEEKRDHIQPTEFIVSRKGRLLSSTYSSSPLGRVDPDEALALMKFIANSRKK